MKYPVTSIFRSLQGEGHFVGYPMTFVRFAGCSVLDCSIRANCDEAPWKATEMLDELHIAERCVRFSPAGIVCLTGGEPTDHDLIPIVDELTRAGFRLHLETSGVREVTGLPIEWITVSPKTPGYRQRIGHALKVIVRPGMLWNDVDALDVGTSFFHRYLQPLDGIDNMAATIALLTSGRNSSGRWALSTQAHKGWGLR